MLAHKTEHWLDEYKNTKCGLYEKDIGPSPISEVKYLSELYIIELKLEVASLAVVSAKYFSLIASCHSEQLKNGKIPDTFLEDYTPIINELTSSISDLVKKAGHVAEQI